MKVLAIRGRNLASLAGDFSVELSELGAAGLFAITGPTGAGKSTLLDALCLPLYNRTPRLGGRGTKPSQRAPAGAQESEISSGDARNLLRRGTGEGFAEVDFSACDGRAYRARWSVRRARGLPGGRLQNIDIELFELPELLPKHLSRSTETLQRIEELVGLTYEQFCRSVLLAQGDFAAFLKASQHERSELLEAMTGTEIYSAISRLAFETAAEGSARMKALREGLPVLELSETDFEALDKEIAGLQAREQALRAAGAQLEKHAQWHADLRRHSELEAEARGALQAAGAGLEELRPLREELAGVEAAQPLRAELAALERASARHSAAGQKLEDAQLLEKAAGDALENARAILQAAQKAREKTQQARQALVPELARARELDTKIEGARALAGEARAAAAEAEQQAGGASNELAAARKGLDEAENRKKALERWLRDNSRWQNAAAQWPLLKELLGQAGAAKSAADEATAALKRLEAEMPEARARCETADAAMAEAGKAREKAQALADKAEARKSGSAPPPGKKELERLRQRLAALEELSRLLKNFEQAGSQARQARETEQARRAAAKKSDEEAQARHVAAEAADKALQEQQQKLEWIVSALSLDEHRQRLKSGEQCPLCGSTEHPMAAHAAPGAALEKEHRREIGKLRKALEAGNKAEAAARERADEAEKQAEQSGRQAAEHEEESAKALSAWKKTRAALKDIKAGELSATPGGTTEAELEKRRSAAAAACDAAQVQAAEAGEIAEACAKALADLNTWQQAAVETADAARGVRQALERCEEKAARTREQRAAHEKLGAAARGQARPIFSAWPEWEREFDAAPQKFMALCERESGQFTLQLEARAGAEASSAELRPRLSALEQALREKRSAESAANSEKQRRDLELEQLEKQRTEALHGRSASEAEAAANEVLARAQDDAGRAQDAERGAELGAKLALERLRQAQDEVRAAETEHSSQRQSWSGRLAAEKLDEAQVRARLSRDEAWLREARKRIAQQEQARAEAQGRHDERMRARAAHEASANNAMPLEEIQQRREALEGEVQACRGELEAKTGLRAVERGRRMECERAAGEITAWQKKADLWEGINALIGSRDGQKFRTFAQSLTLNLLLAHANHTLKELAPRYALERTPGTDMDLQIVDLDMGREKRAINTLSGGESFLVSLGLALGLSSMAARRTRIESLFIDEGFGSLDGDTLETALGVLDALQAGGRQVGIISHVPGLAERIGAQVRIVPRGGGRSEARVV